MNKLFKSKTFWTGVVSIITGGAGFQTGDIPTPNVIELILGGLAVIFLRSGIEKNK